MSGQNFIFINLRLQKKRKRLEISGRENIWESFVRSCRLKACREVSDEDTCVQNVVPRVITSEFISP